ncbi:MAG: hypothetical protein JSV49_11490 [Thermoplasmata archaeon]|nr:MAG: hypothetical protein JSV49_11490 [Thermoplasmata archaeon]
MDKVKDDAAAAPDFMQLMRDWYTQSNELIRFMYEYYSFKPGKGPDESGSAPKAKQLQDDLWEGYIKNMDQVLNQLKTTFNFNQQLMENVLTSWKDFQEAVNKNIKIGDNGHDQEQPTPLPNDIWSKWLEYTNSMNSQLLNSYNLIYNQGAAQEDSNADFGKPLSGKRINKGPAFNDVNRLNKESIKEMNELFNTYNTELTREYLALSQAVLLKNESGIEKSQEFMEKWSESYNSFMKELISTPAFNVILNENLKQQLLAKKQLEDAMEDQWKLVGLPTRTDIMELHREVHDLQIKLNRLSKHILKTGNKSS